MSEAHPFGGLLRQRRHELGWTQAELAERSGYALPSIKAFEQGRRRPPRDEARRLAAILGLAPGSASYEALVEAAHGRSLPAVVPPPASPPPPAGVAPLGAAVPAPDPPAPPALSPATPSTLSPRQRRRDPRYALIDRVRQHWIDGVLTPSFAAIAPIQIDLSDRADLLVSAGRARRPEDRASPMAAFEASGGELLILGAPGAGKTTALLTLAALLLDLAERDSGEPVPVVFSLASWGDQRQPLADWLVSELHERYKLPRKLARRLLEEGQLILLLDGLDEVRAGLRADCVRAINAFHAERRAELAVCCRTSDYEALGARLDLRGAVGLNPLSAAQVEQTLAEQGAGLAALRAHLAHDERLRAMAASPLMLGIMALVYRDSALGAIALGQESDLRLELLDRYVAHVLGRRRGDPRISPAQTRRYLGWLAGRMQAGSQTVFYPDQLQADWLSPAQRRRYALIDRACGALLAGLSLSLAYLLIIGLYALIRRPHPVYAEGLLPDVLTIFLLGGLVGGLFGAVNERPYRAAGAIWPMARERLMGCIAGGAIFGLIATAMTGGLPDAILAAILGAAAGTFAPLPSLRPRRVIITEPRRWSWRRTLRLLPACLGGGATLGLLVGLLIGHIDGLLGPLLGPLAGSVAAGLLTGLGASLAFSLSHSEVIREPDRPNQGVRRSIYNGLVAGALGFLLGGLLGLYVAVGPVTWLIMGAQGALVGALGFGLLAALSHTALRLTLWLGGAAPLRYIHFLDSCVDRILLRRIGGGYSFVHHELQSYFAGLEAPAAPDGGRVGLSRHRAGKPPQPLLADLAGLALLTAALCGLISAVRQGAPAAPAPPQPASVRFMPGPDYTGRLVTARRVQAGELVRVAAYGLMDIGTYERGVPPQGRERGFMGSPLGDSYKLARDHPTGALLCKVTGEEDLLWRLCGPKAQFEARASGQLEFLINDTTIERHAGAFDIVIEITTSSAP